MENTVATATAITVTITRSKFFVPLVFGIIKTPSWIHFGVAAAITGSARNATVYVKLQGSKTEAT